MAIRALIFDWGDTLEFIDNQGFLKEVAALHGVDEQRLREVELESRQLFDAGELTSDDHLARIGNALGITLDDSYYDLLFGKYVTLNEPLLRVIRKLKGRFFLAISSNNNPAFFAHMKRDTDFPDLFERFVLSFEMRLKKPEPAMYLAAIEGRDIRPEECVYLDDRARYVAGAAELGMSALRYTTVERFLAELAMLGVPVDI